MHSQKLKIFSVESSLDQFGGQVKEEKMIFWIHGRVWLNYSNCSLENMLFQEGKRTETKGIHTQVDFAVFRKVFTLLILTVLLAD